MVTWSERVFHTFLSRVSDLVQEEAKKGSCLLQEQLPFLGFYFLPTDLIPLFVVQHRCESDVLDRPTKASSQGSTSKKPPDVSSSELHRT